MKALISVIILFLGVSNLAGASLGRIADWKETPGISEEQAVNMAEQALENYFAEDQDGEACGLGVVWGFEREADLRPDRPERGEIFALTVFARGPDMGCSGSRNFDCRVVFNKFPSQTVWQVEYVDCEPTSPVY